MFRDVGEGLWLHKEPQHTWRVGRALGGGDTLLTSAACAESPPLCGWSGGDQQHVEALVCVDTAVWAGLSARVLCTDLKAIREKTDDEAEAEVAQPARDDGAGVAVDDVQDGEADAETEAYEPTDVCAGAVEAEVRAYDAAKSVWEHDKKWAKSEWRMAPSGWNRDKWAKRDWQDAGSSSDWYGEGNSSTGTAGETVKWAYHETQTYNNQTNLYLCVYIKYSCIYCNVASAVDPIRYVCMHCIVN